jgi:hypothetical protein
VRSAVGEFEVVGASGFAEHNPIEMLVIFEVADANQPKPDPVHCFGAL